MNRHAEDCSPNSPELDYLTVVLHNSRTAIVPVAGEPVLLRSFVAGDEWQGVISGLARALHHCGDVDIRFIGEGIDPWDTDSDDRDAARHAQSATVVATYEGDRLDELRRFVQEFLHTSGMSNCWFLHTGSAAMEVVYSEGHTVEDLEGLLHAEGCDTPDDLVDHLDSQTEGAGWIDWEGSDDRILTVCVGQRGIGLEYPFTMGEFWSTVVELDEDHEGIATDD